ncbi:MAG TPA: TonB-dependent receptor [Rhizomicrobium sp.]|nr:TonB-dependent receptor [Rhizomicrobium sp.]
MSIFLRAHLGASLLLLGTVLHARADVRIETVIVTGEQDTQPNSKAHVDADQAHAQINAVNGEDMLKYLPSIVVRKRHYGDTQDPIATRTSGVGASARSLIFVDGILVSSLIGNNNTTASPHFGIAAPQDVSSIDVLYGPFAAEYAGNSIGAVVNIATAMPEHFTAYADALGAVQPFAQYASRHAYGTWQLSGGVGDRDGAFAWRLSANHLDSTGQPLAYVTVLRPASQSGNGTPVTGGFDGLNRGGAPIGIFGAGGIEHQVQDTDTLKLAYDFANGWRASYVASVFHQSDDADAESYLRDASGTPVYAGSVNFEGYNYTIGTSSFSNNVYDWQQTHLAQGLSLKSASGGDLSWELLASDYAYLDDTQRIPTTALPTARGGGAGTITRTGGTGWYTLDAKAVWHGLAGNALSFGAHRDAEIFSQSKFTTADWIQGDAAGLATRSQGRTETNALWLQDDWAFAPGFTATGGLRYEDWRAHDGLNYSASPPLNVHQPELKGDFVSPKASLSWSPRADWRFSASWGQAWRMPTVTELYQAVTTGSILSVPNPDLSPEHANSYELAVEHMLESSRVRVSLFQEDITNALISQLAPLPPGSTTLASYVQNVPRVRSRGVEIAFLQEDVLVDGLELSGSATYVDGRTIRDPVLHAAEGKQLPQLPKLRASAVATYRPDSRLAFTLAARYSDRAYGTIDNSDPVSETYQGFGSYLVVDARVQYRVTPNWTASFGVDNLNDDKYFLFHPFPQRTFVMEIHYAQ